MTKKFVEARDPRAKVVLDALIELSKLGVEARVHYDARDDEWSLTLDESDYEDIEEVRHILEDLKEVIKE